MAVSKPVTIALPVGIDLGTTYSAVAYLDVLGQPRTILNERGEKTTASAVYIKPDRTVVVGHEALETRRDRPDRVAVNFKRDMGERLYREAVGGKEFSPQALSALVLKKLIQDAQRELYEISGAVITVPAYFGDAKRRATQEAGRIAGINVLDIINEPTAAAMANAFQQYLAMGGEGDRLDVAQIAARAPTTTLVYDLGGGTFDVTVIRIDSNSFEVLATGGEVKLGGLDFDERMVTFYCDEFQRRYGVDPRDTSESLERIRATCELAKIALSSNDQTVIIGEYLGRKLQLPVSRARFNQLTADLITRTQISTEMLLEDALLSWDQIDEILMVGGSSRIPRVSEMLEEISGKQPSMSIAPDEIVSHGAAIHAAILELGERSPGRGVDGKTAGEKDALSEEQMAEQQRQMQAIFDDNMVQTARQVRLTNVNSHGLGVIVRSSREKRTVNSVVIPENTPLPASRVKIFGTEAENQRRVRLRIVEGDARDPRACTQIGECLIEPLPKGLPKGAPVEVAFSYDASGRIHVKATEKTHNITAQVELHHQGGYSAKELDDMTDNIAELDVE